jgi:Spy/CpxP family protein refolding chaperone
MTNNLTAEQRAQLQRFWGMDAPLLTSRVSSLVYQAKQLEASLGGDEEARRKLGALCQGEDIDREQAAFIRANLETLETTLREALQSLRKTQET